MKWVLMVENFDSSKPSYTARQACDPKEVIYSLCRIDDSGNILKRAGHITGCGIDWIDIMKEAIEDGIYEKREIEAQSEAVYKAIKRE